MVVSFRGRHFRRPGLDCRSGAEMNQQPRGMESVRRFKADSDARSSLAYRALVLFSLFYFVRPEDFIPLLYVVPIGQITGGGSFFSLLFFVPPAHPPKLHLSLTVLPP